MLGENMKYVCLVLAGAVVVLGISFVYVYQENAVRQEKCHKEHPLLNGDALCGNPDVIKKTGYLKTRQEIIDYIDLQRKEGTLEDAAVYFLDPIHGPNFEINSLAEFAPASLLKLPLAFVFLVAAEAEPELFTQKVVYTGTTTVETQGVQPHTTAIAGREYTIGELLRLMIVYSDNASYEVLEQFIANQPQRAHLRQEIFQELGLIDPKSRIESTLSVRSYAGLFRVLYNVSYLSIENSQKLLSWLVESDYVEGLVKGVPEGTLVANKFGERTDFSTGTKQLHDCGIVYYPENPYLLCVMTRGTDFAELQKVIAEISRIVYTEVDSRRID